MPFAASLFSSQAGQETIRNGSLAFDFSLVFVHAGNCLVEGLWRQYIHSPGTKNIRGETAGHNGSINLAICMYSKWFLCDHNLLYVQVSIP
jgi:hypothetical protein